MDEYHLNGKRMSRRAVRIKQLDSADCEKNLTDAAKLLGKDSIQLELSKAIWRAGVQQMVVEVTDPCDDPSTAKWKKVSAQDLADLDHVFNPRDMMVLESLYRDYHEVSKDELDSIVGKGRAV